MDKRSHIYYITSLDGQCMINEIIPHDDQAHITIFELKSDHCYGFTASEDGSTFYFVDDKNVTNKLERMKGSKSLVETKELIFKDNDLPHVKLYPLYPNLVFSEKYLIKASKIFYLFEDHPLEKGILDMEELAEIKEGQFAKKEYVQGPYKTEKASEFMTVFKYGLNLVYKVRVFQLPDSQTSTLQNDYGNKTDVTSFLDSGEILLKI